MDKIFLIPLCFVLVGTCYCLLRSRSWVGPTLLAASVALLPPIFLGIRNLGPFFGGADIGAGLFLIVSSLATIPVILLIYIKNSQIPVVKSAKYSALILGFNFLIGFGNHFYLLRQNQEYKLRSELNCDTLPFHCAIKENNVNKIEILRRQNRNIEAQDGWGRTALFSAFYSDDNYEFIRELLKHGANVNRSDESGDVLIHIVLSSNPPNFKLADLLFEYGADPNLKFGLHKKISILNDAVIKMNNETVNYLLAKGADPTLKDEYGYDACERMKMHSVSGLTQLALTCR